MAVIGISGNIFEAKERAFYNRKALHVCEFSMAKMIEDNGHTAIILPVHQDLSQVPNLINLIDGLILSGGIDICSENYNEKLMNPKWKGQMIRDKFEFELLKQAKGKKLPILGICRGFQLMNIFYGGSLYQDIKTQIDNTHEHRDQDKYDTWRHDLKIIKDTPLHQLIEKEDVKVNSIHHQSVKELGKNLEVMAFSDDGLIEAFCDSEADFIWGVQWHLEWMQDDPDQQKILKKFLNKTN